MYPRFDSSFMSQTNRYAVNSLFQISRISALVRFSICNLPLRHQILISKEYLEMLELIGAEKVCSFAVRFPLGDEFYPFSNNGEGCTKGPNKRKTEKTRFNGISSNFRGVVVAVTWKIFKQKAGKRLFAESFVASVSFHHYRCCFKCGCCGGLVLDDFGTQDTLPAPRVEPNSCEYSISTLTTCKETTHPTLRQVWQEPKT